MANNDDTNTINWRDMNRRMEESTIPGSSLAGTQLSTLMNKGHSIVCGIVVQNWTNMELSLPHVTVNTGSLSKPPASVSPGQREAVIAHKYGFSMKGTSGLMSWLLSVLGRRVVVMWNVPYIKSTNSLAVGITTKGSTFHNDAWYTNIDVSSDSPDLNVKRGKYYETCNEVMIEDDCIEVLGTMGTGSTPEVNITVRPKLHKYLVTRCGGHRFPVERGRWHNVSRADRLCILCDSADIGDEFHYIMSCNYLKQERENIYRVIAVIMSIPSNLISYSLHVILLY